MKQFLLLTFLASSLVTIAQSKEHAGTYTLELGKDTEHFETNKLTLNPGGTFLFHFYDNRTNGTPKERTKYGKGTWASTQRIITLKVETTDIDATHILNLNNTKLRFDTKSPRDKSNRDIKTSVRFIQSEISWLKGRTLLKKE